MNSQTDNTTAHSASDYDTGVLQTIPFYTEFHAQVIRLVSAYQPSPNSWLDTGCGTGNLIAKCCAEFPDTAFTLSDPSEKMLAVAKEKLGAYSQNISFLPPAPTQDISVNSRFDVITAIQAHHYLSVQERADTAKVCHRLLNPNGLFITFENIRPLTDIGTEIGLKSWYTYQREKGKTEDEAKAHIDRFGKEYFPVTVSAHLDLYRACGFRVVELLWYAHMQAGFYCIK